MPAFDSAPTGVTGSIAPAASARRRFVDASGRLRSHSRRERSSSNEDYDDLRPNLQAIVPGAHGGGVDSIPQPRTTTLEVDNEPVPDQDFRVRGVREWLDNGEQREEYLIDADDLSLRRLLLDDTSKDSDSSLSRQTKKFRDFIFKRQYTAFDSQNKESAQSPFHGFFTLFWMGTGIFMIQTAAKNFATYGNIFGSNDLMHIMFERDLITLALSDGLLWIATGFGWALQRMVVKGWLSWDREGWIIQHVWQTLYFFAALSWTQYRHWAWTHTFFFVVHCLVMLMKQHSYAFYNGHLSELYKTRETLRKALKELQDKVPAAGTSETRPLARSLTTGHLDQKPNLPGWHQERKTSAKESEEIRQAIISGEPLDLDQILLFERMLKWEIDAISSELQGKSTTYNGTYPHNLTLKNHYEYTLLPTLVYELEYPRTDHINWLYVLEKAVATCGVLFVMQLVSQTYVYPVVVRTVQWRKAGVPVSERLDRFPSIISDLIFPFMIEYMMTWYVIFESVLNLLAELTYFADRGFYGDWWNSVSWDQYARDWNKPVHVFLLRHVYHSSISTLLVSKHVATLITFTLSALVHELLMFCLFKRVRGYLLILQMCQLPLVWLSRTKWLRDKKTLGNLVFWLGLFTGPSLLCSLYLII